MKTKTGVLAAMALAGSASAEVNSFRIGEALNTATDVVGFSILDSTNAIYDYVGLLLLLGLGAIVWYKWIKK